MSCFADTARDSDCGNIAGTVATVLSMPVCKLSRSGNVSKFIALDVRQAKLEL